MREESLRALWLRAKPGPGVWDLLSPSAEPVELARPERERDGAFEGGKATDAGS